MLEEFQIEILMVWLIAGVAIVAVAVVMAGFLPMFRQTPANWRLLSISGIVLAIFGVIWVLRAWEPTFGPYRVDEIYPFGTALQTWQVSFGFSWLAFGALFFVLTLFVAGRPSFSGWLALFVCWLVCMLPHFIIVLALALSGEDTAKVVDLSQRTSEPKFGLIIGTAFASLIFLISSIGGFIWTGWQLRKNK